MLIYVLYNGVDRRGHVSSELEGGRKGKTFAWVDLVAIDWPWVRMAESGSRMVLLFGWLGVVRVFFLGAVDEE